jgi:quinol monooxygenase YgiN
MIVTIATVTDVDQFLETFSTVGVDKRREHGCVSSHVYRDPDDSSRLIVLFDWSREDYEGFLADPEIPAIARQLALQGPPVEAELLARYDA